MPIHDWTRVTAGTWHAFHLSWIAEIQLALNGGLLPRKLLRPGRADRRADGAGCAHLADPGASRSSIEAEPPGGGWPSPLLRPGPDSSRSRDDRIRPQTHGRSSSAMPAATGSSRSSSLSRRATRPRNSPSARLSTKLSRRSLRGYHLLIVDLFPPTPRSQGIHAAIWAEFSDASFELPPDEPLTLAAYSAGPVKSELTSSRPPSAAS